MVPCTNLGNPSIEQKAPAKMHGTSAGIEAAKCPDKAIFLTPPFLRRIFSNQNSPEPRSIGSHRLWIRDRRRRENVARLATNLLARIVHSISRYCVDMTRKAYVDRRNKRNRVEKKKKRDFTVCSYSQPVQSSLIRVRSWGWWAGERAWMALLYAPSTSSSFAKEPLRQRCQ